MDFYGEKSPFSPHKGLVQVICVVFCIQKQEGNHEILAIAWIVFLGGCCYGILSTFVKLAYSAGFTVSAVTGGQYFFGVVLAWFAVLCTKNKKLTRMQISKLILSGIPFGLTGLFYYQALQTLNASLAHCFSVPICIDRRIVGMEVS